MQVLLFLERHQNSWVWKYLSLTLVSPGFGRVEAGGSRSSRSSSVIYGVQVDVSYLDLASTLFLSRKPKDLDSRPQVGYRKHLRPGDSTVLPVPHNTTPSQST